MLFQNDRSYIPGSQGYTLVLNVAVRPVAQTAAVFATLLLLGACGSGGNIKTAADYHSPKPPSVAHPTYQPFAAYGQTSAIWHPPVIDRSGTILRPSDTSTSWDRPNYEGSGWAQTAAPSPYGGPAGTF